MTPGEALERLDQILAGRVLWEGVGPKPHWEPMEVLRAAYAKAGEMEAELADMKAYMDSGFDTARSRKSLQRAEDAKKITELEAALREVQQWFRQKAWEGELDPSSFGGHPYTPNERAIGYGTYRDPRFLPRALAPATPEVQHIDFMPGMGEP